MMKFEKILFLLSISFVAFHSNAQTGTKLILSNPVNANRVDELIVITRKQLENKLGNVYRQNNGGRKREKREFLTHSK